MVALWCWMLLAGGCAEPSASSDPARYRAALEIAQPESLAPCAGIQDASLRGDCQLALSERMASSGEWCGQIEADPWRSECWFSASEGARDAGKWEQAIAYCLQAGMFVDSCSQHLWQPQLNAIVQPHLGKDFRATVDDANWLYEQWFPYLGAQMTAPFWYTYCRTVFRGAEALNPAWCAQVPEARKAICFDVQRQLRERPPPGPTPRTPRRPQ